MKVSYSWLTEWIPALPEHLDVQALADRLTLAGLEVDELEAAAPPFAGVVVARIESASPHPDADRLQVCTVNAGPSVNDGQPVQIVCGAPNARAGLVAPLATVGGKLPGAEGPFKIKKAKLRGVESFGMLCSARELGLGDGHAGLLELPDDLETGADVRDALQLNDQSLEIELTPNRGDCTGMRGVAREVAALLELDWTQPEPTQANATIDDTRGVSVASHDDCSSYLGRVVRGVNAKAPTPLWMSERLRRGGLRPKSVLVDITNYVLLELGQPMHAFDNAKLQGDVTVRRATPGETMTLLNDDVITMGDAHLVIADERGAVALAGAMGGSRSAVGDDTVDVFLESACFAPSAVSGTGRDFKLHSDALYRYERGVDPSLQGLALARATELVLSLCGGQAGPVTQASSDYDAPSVGLRRSQLDRVIGGHVDDTVVLDILSRLGFAPTATDAGWMTTVPPHRYDVRVEVDLIEEVARVVGYDHLPGGPGPVSQAFAGVPETTRPESLIVQRLAARGYTEVVTYAFVDAASEAALASGDNHAPIAVDNPIAEQYSVMRTTLWSGLLQAWKTNAARGQSRARLFETGLRFERVNKEFVQTRTLAMLLAGSSQPESWVAKDVPVDFYDAKADLQAAAGSLALDTVADALNALQPGQSARVMHDGQPIGWIGRLHPSVARKLDVPRTPILVQVDLDALCTVSLPDYRPLTTQPASRRDIAIIVDASVPAALLQQTVSDTAGANLTRTVVFDVYQGDGVHHSTSDSSKSVALGLIFQDKSRTLTDDEVDGAVAQVKQALVARHNAEFRD